MKYLITFFSAIVLFTSCKNNEDVNSKEKEQSPQTTNIQNVKSKENNNQTKQLIIQGKNIWVRKTPETGDVIMKLNTGDVCELLNETKEMQVRDMLDKWYKIKFNDTIGWVFGSQTNLKKEIKPDGFKKTLVDFSKNIKNQKFSNFIHKDLGIKIMYNPGAFCILDTVKSFRVLNFNKKTIQKNIFNKKPEGDFCDGYPNEKDGLYYWKAKINDLPASAKIISETEVKAIKLQVPDKYKTNQIFEVQLIKDKGHKAYYFFINIGTQWYLLCENYADCSA